VIEEELPLRVEVDGLLEACPHGFAILPDARGDNLVLV
jgi:hypothetical protein